MKSITSQLTPVEKILGKQYKWWYILKYSFYKRTTYQIDNALFSLGQLLTLLGTLLTWTVASGQELGSNELNLSITYFIVGTLFYNVINVWPSFYGYTIKHGDHTSDLLYPQSLYKIIWSRWYGQALYQNLIAILGIVILSPLWFQYINTSFDFKSIVLTILLLPIAHIILFFIELIVGLSAFFITEINGISLNFGFIKQLLAGRLFPLGALISIQWVNSANPFAFLFYHPMQIFLNEYDLQTTLSVFGFGILWCIILYVFTSFYLKLGLKRNESVGL